MKKFFDSQNCLKFEKFISVRKILFRSKNFFRFEKFFLIRKIIFVPRNYVKFVCCRNELGEIFRFSFWKLWNLIKSINSFAIFDIPPSWRLGSTIASNRKFHLIRQNCGDSICQTLEKIATRWREDPRSVLFALI